MKIFSADVLGAPNNRVYPNAFGIGSAEELRRAVSHDYVCAEYRDARRSVETFVTSDCLPMDIDNDHSDQEKDWITPEDILRLFPDVTLAIHFSRNHMKPKAERSARPRFHVLFGITPCADAAAYRAMKSRLHSRYPFFDGNALDAARFMFGTENPEVMWVPGGKTLDRTLEEAAAAEEAFARTPITDDTIPEGKRNSEMSRYAARVLKRFGNTERARGLFSARAALCAPPLPKRELKAIWDSGVRFYEKICRVGGYVPPEKYETGLRSELKLYPPMLSDLGEATVLAAEYGKYLRYSPETQFMVYQDGVWHENDEMAHTLLDRLISRQTEELTPLMNRPTVGTEEREYARFLLSCTNHSRSECVLKTVRHLVLFRVGELDARANLLNTPAGEIDLRTGEMTPHNPEHYHTRVTAVSPDRKNMDLWLRHIEEITCGDAELARYLQLTSGESLFGSVRNEALQIELGSGSNGKSTYTNTKLRVLGSYGGQISSESLTLKNRYYKNWELGELRGKRFVVAGELDEGQRLNVAFLKKICSSDPIMAEKKRKDPFTFLPSYSLVLYTNYLPKVNRMDNGTWRRLKVIPFNAVLKGEGLFKNYTEHLVSECGGAVLQWMIDGAKDVYAADFHIEEPKSVRDAIAAYREQSDWLRDFLEACCALEDGAESRSSELYQRYREYSDDCGERPRTMTDFSHALSEIGLNRRHTEKGTVFSGIRLRWDSAEEFLGSFG